MWMAKLTHPQSLYVLVHGVCCVGSRHEQPLCWFVTGVQRVAHGMFDIALGPCIGWQMVLPLVHPIDVVPT